MPLCHVVQNSGVGMLIQGLREWENYSFAATVNAHLAASTGVAVCVQGLKRYYALLLCNDQKLRLIKELDGRITLAEKDFAWELDQNYQLNLQTQEATLVAEVNGEAVFEFTDEERPLLFGSVALLCEEGRVGFGHISISP